MFAIISKQQSDGTYRDVGTNTRWMTGDYKSERTLVRYGLPLTTSPGRYRLEIWLSHERFYRDDPYVTVELDR